MAGTRRRSRVSDPAMIPHDMAGSARIPSVVEEHHDGSVGVGQHSRPAPTTATATTATTTTTLTSDEAPNRATTGFCRRCNEGIGEFYNSFTKITGTYYLPSLLGSYSSNLKTHGKPKAATVGTDLDGCTIQPLACPSCTDTLGFTAVATPGGKEAFRGRDFFKLPKINLRCEVGANQYKTVEPQVEAAAPGLSLDAIEDSARSSLVPEAEMEVDTRPPPAAHPPTSSLSGHYGPQHHDAHHHHRRHRSDHHAAHHHQPTPLQQVEANRQPPAQPHPSRSPSIAVQGPHKSPSTAQPSPPVLASPQLQEQHAPPPPREVNAKDASALSANHPQASPALAPHSHLHSPAQQHRPASAIDGQHYPRKASEVQLDAIERLQTQISQNSGALEIHGRDLGKFQESVHQQGHSLRQEFQGQLNAQHIEIKRVDAGVARLFEEMHNMRELLEGLRRDVKASKDLTVARTTVGTAPSGPTSNSAMDLMADQIHNIAQKATEVDSLKLSLEIIKNRIQRLEATADTPPLSAIPQSATHTHPPPPRFPSPRDPSQPSAQSSHTVASYHAGPASVPHINTSVVPTHRPAPAQFHPPSSQQVATPEVSRTESSHQTPSAWTSVNASAKRSHPNGVEATHEAHPSPLSSPKRPKLAHTEPQVDRRGSLAHTQAHPEAHHVQSQGHAAPPPRPVPSQHHSLERMDTDESEPRIHTHSHTMPPAQSQSQTPSQERLPPSSMLSSQRSAFVPYGTQDAPSDESWRPESQRVIEYTPTGRGRGRGRGGGPGSRGGRVRKSVQHQHTPHQELGTPEWEREDWRGATDSQTSPDGFYSPARASRGIVRRGSGGSGGRRPSSATHHERAVSLGLQGVTPGPGMIGVGLPADPYAHTKKTRTKPIRNADGILIRKDGRPDMRSQSSAANLRRVHAKKEEEKAMRGFTPSGLGSEYNSPSMGHDTPSPTADYEGGSDATTSAQKRHAAVMRRMFPEGVEQSRREHDYARQVFETEQGHTAHARGQHHLHQHPHPPSPLQIKREQLEKRRFIDSQSPRAALDGDDKMDLDEEGRTPSAQSENSGGDSQYHDAPAAAGTSSKDMQHEGGPVQHSVQQSIAETPQKTGASQVEQRTTAA